MRIIKSFDNLIFLIFIIFLVFILSFIIRNNFKNAFKHLSDHYYFFNFWYFSDIRVLKRFVFVFLLLHYFRFYIKVWLLYYYHRSLYKILNPVRSRLVYYIPLLHELFLKFALFTLSKKL